MDRTRSLRPPPGAAALRAEMVAKLKLAASLRRMKDSRPLPPTPIHTKGVSEGERIASHSNDPDTECRKAGAVGHELNVDTEEESGTESEPNTSQAGMGQGYQCTLTIRAASSSATTSGKSTRSQRSSIHIPLWPSSDEAGDSAEDEQDTTPATDIHPASLVVSGQPIPVVQPAPILRKRTHSRSGYYILEGKGISRQPKSAKRGARMSLPVDDQIPPIPVPGPDALGPYSPLRLKRSNTTGDLFGLNEAGTFTGNSDAPRQATLKGTVGQGEQWADDEQSMVAVDMHPTSPVIPEPPEPPESTEPIIQPTPLPRKRTPARPRSRSLVRKHLAQQLKQMEEAQMSSPTDEHILQQGKDEITDGDDAGRADESQIHFSHRTGEKTLAGIESRTPSRLQTQLPDSSPQRAPTEAWVSSPSAEVVSPQAGSFLPSTLSVAVFSDPVQPELHDNRASLVPRLAFPAGASSTSGHPPSQHQQTCTQSRPPSFADWEEVTDKNAPLLQSAERGKKEGRGWQQRVLTRISRFGRGGNRAESRHFRPSSIVTGEHKDSTSGERASNMVSSSKVDSTHPDLLGLPSIRQNSHARTSIISLANHVRNSVSPMLPASSTDPRLADGKLHAFPGIRKLEAERERKLRERGQSISGNHPESPGRHPAAVVNTYPFAQGYVSDISSDIDLDSLEPHPFARGAFGDVRRAFLRDGRRVAIKCLRFYTSAQDTGRHKLEKKSLKEIRVWSFLAHENVLPLLGLCVINNELGMVSEFMPNGNIQEYIRHNPNVDRYRLAINVCAGLAYLHEHPKHVVHGDLKAVNVVVDADGVPKLTDFGLAQMIRAEDSTEPSSSSLVGGTSRWMARELICPMAPDSAGCKPTSASDVYSLGMTIYETFSGTLPFSNRKIDAQVILAIMRYELPERIPNVFTEGLWELLLRCWRSEPHARPTAREVLTNLQDLRHSQNGFEGWA